MKTFKLFQWLIILVIILVAVPGAAASVPQGPGDSVESGGVESISGPSVWYALGPSPNSCFTEGASQRFCFQATSETTDNDYVYYLWMRFPDDWVVGDAYIYGEPLCANGGTFGTFSWYVPPDRQNELEIDHVRYQAVNDACTATYCVQVTSGSPSPGVDYAKVSWYWRSSEYGSPPFYPCSNDGYTPDGWPACDEMAWAGPPLIDPCPLSRIYLPAVFRNSP